MEDIYPQILDYLKTVDVLIEIFKLTKDHRMRSFVTQSHRLDIIHELVSKHLTLQQKLACYTEKEIKYATDMKDTFVHWLHAQKGTYDLIQLLKDAEHQLMVQIQGTP